MGLSGERELLLIVDDDPGIRSPSRRFLLATNGWEVIEAGCADGCAEFAGLEQPDAILPGMATSSRQAAEVRAQEAQIAALGRQWKQNGGRTDFSDRYVDRIVAVIE